MILQFAPAGAKGLAESGTIHPMYDLYTFKKKKKNRAPLILGSAVVLLVAGVLLYQIPGIQRRLDWRIEIARTYVRNVLNPVDALPTVPVMAAAQAEIITLTPTPPGTAGAAAETTPAPTATPLPVESPTPTLTPTPLPDKVELTPPAYEKQDANNCGPTTLSLYLKYYGWEGDQFVISKELKPFTDDKNVNIDELMYFAHNRVGWLNTEFRVGGTLDQLRSFLAAGIPVAIEETSMLDQSYWPNDDRWAGHYLLITGYDDTAKVFITQDTYYGPNKRVPYAKLDANWQSFNRVFFLIYTPDQAPMVQAMLGSDWDVDVNRQKALDTALAETKADPQNAFAWFNVGSNLVYFERYGEAAQAYDTARNLGLPQRMLRYQFGPFISYFHIRRDEDLLALTDYALKRTPTSEEAMLWRGWALYRLGKRDEAVQMFQDALGHHPNYGDAIYAIDFMRTN